MKIPLGHNYFAVIDDEDAGKTSPYNWYAQIRKSGTYAIGYLRGYDSRKTVFMHRIIMNAKPGGE